MTQSNDLSQRIDRTEGQIVDLQLAANLVLQAIDKNSADIADLLEVSRRNSEAISGLLEISRQNSEANRQNSEANRQNSEAISRHNESIASINATIERMDRLFDYLIRRDQGHSGE
jgi:methyl-accepting chemotaxis protein